MKYLITTIEPIRGVTDIEILGDTSKGCNFSKIDEHTIEIHCDGQIDGLKNYTCSVVKI